MPEYSGEFSSLNQNESGSNAGESLSKQWRNRKLGKLANGGMIGFNPTVEAPRHDSPAGPDYEYHVPGEDEPASEKPADEQLLSYEPDTEAQAELNKIVTIEETMPDVNIPHEKVDALDKDTESSIEKKRNAVMEKIKGKEGFAAKRFLAAAALTAVAFLVSGALIVHAVSNKAKDSQSTTKETDEPSITETTDDPAPTTEPIGEVVGEAIGIKDGYNEYGMFANKGKSCYEFNFADASRVAEVCDNDPKEMVKYTIENQVETLADYIPHLPDELKPDSYKGLTILEVEEKLEGLNDEDFDVMLKYCKECFDKAKVRYTYVEGKRQNALMMPDDNATYDNLTHEDIKLVRNLTHEDIKLVRESFYENNTITEFYWEDDDGNEIGSIPVKATPIYEEDEGTNSGGGVGSYSLRTGNTYYGSVNKAIVGFSGCMQVIGDPDSPVYEGVPENPTPEAPTPPAPEAPTPAKDAENLTRIDENAHEDIANNIHTESIVVTPTTDVNVVETQTEQPTSNEYTGTEATIVQNEPSEATTSTSSYASPENDYSQDLGGANDDEAEPEPVEPDDEGQATANEEAEQYNEGTTPHAPGYDNDGGTSNGEDGDYYDLDDLLNP
jgi:hypothetical protein